MTAGSWQKLEFYGVMVSETKNGVKREEGMWTLYDLYKCSYPKPNKMVDAYCETLVSFNLNLRPTIIRVERKFHFDPLYHTVSIREKYKYKSLMCRYYFCSTSGVILFDLKRKPVGRSRVTFRCTPETWDSLRTLWRTTFIAYSLDNMRSGKLTLKVEKREDDKYDIRTKYTIDYMRTFMHLKFKLRKENFVGVKWEIERLLEVIYGFPQDLSDLVVAYVGEAFLSCYFDTPKLGELMKPWHGWEYDMKEGREEFQRKEYEYATEGEYAAICKKNRENSQ